MTDTPEDVRKRAREAAHEIRDFAYWNMDGVVFDYAEAAAILEALILSEREKARKEERERIATRAKAWAADLDEFEHKAAQAVMNAFASAIRQEPQGAKE